MRLREALIRSRPASGKRRDARRVRRGYTRIGWTGVTAGNQEAHEGHEDDPERRALTAEVAENADTDRLEAIG